MKRPLVVVTGLPGAGKSTLLGRLRPSLAGPATLLKQAGPSRRRGSLAAGAGRKVDATAWDPFLTLPASRTARDPGSALGWALFRAVDRAGEGPVFLETSGNFEPAWIASALVHWREPGETPGERLSLRRVACVVDARRFVANASSGASLSSRGLALGPADDRSLAETFFRQVEAADVVVLNRATRVPIPRLVELGGFVRAVNPLATVVVSRDGSVAPDLVLSPSLPGPGGPFPEGESFTWRARRPVHPLRFWDWIHESPPGLLRVRGLFWLASRPERAGIYSQTGATIGHGPGPAWWANVPVEEWPMREETLADIAADWDAETGDRRQELLLAGIGIDREALEASLDACLLTDREMEGGPDAWLGFEDPFPEWDEGDAAPRPAEDALPLN